MERAVWRAPGRVNLIGEHTDYNDGYVLPLAIAHGCTASVELTGDGLLRVSSAQRDDTVRTPLDDLAPSAVDGWAAYPAGVVWTMREVDGWPRELTGLAVHVDSDVPDGAGLSSSAALSCSVAAALNEVLDLGLSRAELVGVGRRAENDFVGAPTGGMDQMAALLCTADAVLLCDMRTLATRSVDLDLAGSGLALLVTDTRTPHQHADGEYRARRESCEQAAVTLGVQALRDVTLADLPAALDRLPDDVLRRRTRHVVTENARVLEVVDLLHAGRVGDIGPVMTRSHLSMRDDYEISAPAVDLAVDTTLQAGALGARMTGGGFGGCVIALLPVDRVARARTDTATAFAEARYGEPDFFLARPAAGARRVDGPDTG